MFIEVEESRLERIGYKAFSGSAITAFCCPKQLEEIGELAFYGCK